MNTNDRGNTLIHAKRGEVSCSGYRLEIFKI